MRNPWVTESPGGKNTGLDRLTLLLLLQWLRSRKEVFLLLLPFSSLSYIFFFHSIIFLFLCSSFSQSSLFLYFDFSFPVFPFYSVAFSSPSFPSFTFQSLYVFHIFFLLFKILLVSSFIHVSLPLLPVPPLYQSPPCFSTSSSPPPLLSSSSSLLVSLVTTTVTSWHDGGSSCHRSHRQHL